MDPAIQITLINPDGARLATMATGRSSERETSPTRDSRYAFRYILWGDGSDDIVPVEAGEPTFIDHEYAPLVATDAEPITIPSAISTLAGSAPRSRSLSH